MERTEWKRIEVGGVSGTVRVRIPTGDTKAQIRHRMMKTLPKYVEENCDYHRALDDRRLWTAAQVIVELGPEWEVSTVDEFLSAYPNHAELIGLDAENIVTFNTSSIRSEPKAQEVKPHESDPPQDPTYYTT